MQKLFDKVAGLMHFFPINIWFIIPMILLIYDLHISSERYICEAWIWYYCWNDCLRAIKPNTVQSLHIAIMIFL
jgi:hypothetical protein